MLNIRPAKAGDETLILTHSSRPWPNTNTWNMRLRRAPTNWRATCSATIRACSATSPSGTGQPAGFALWFYNYSTFRGRHGLYLEDLFRRSGVSRLRASARRCWQHLARRCADEGLARFEWWVLDWNTPSIDFYTSQGARLMEEWTVCRVDGEALATLGRLHP